LPIELFDVKTVEPPAQKVLLPETVGVLGNGVEVTTKSFLTSLVHTLETTLTM
jgi:hypothetical protein